MELKVIMLHKMRGGRQLTTGRFHSHMECVELIHVTLEKAKEASRMFLRLCENYDGYPWESRDTELVHGTWNYAL